ncbi:non-ribosomal peptide synthase/polyketide synthase [Corallococcus macrosporus]|uniref:non-ribosomal peptide synthase/polyketide synthase n=1 Tax=Corallococcus macrosporus TaxID=35 RepID=UPI001EE65F0E
MHQGLTELFDALDQRLRPAEGTTWVAAAESSAERPELEALWALSRGLLVKFPSEQVTAQWEVLQGGGPRQGAMDLSLIYFANDEDSLTGPKYELLVEGAKYADANGFSAVWTPERHFHSFGGLYPQPAVVAGALATITRNLSLRSGSVVLPLHDPLLIAEQWSVVDNLSGGRAGLSVATGWHVADFTFAPQNFEDRRNILLRNLETVRALWRGEKVRRPGGGGTTVEVGLRPRPVQKDLPVWLTAAGSPETFRLAGEVGAGVLTGLLTQSLEELKQKVALYREAWRRNGHPGRGQVALMLHAFIGDDEQEVLRTVRKPLLSYFRSSAEITANLLAAQGYQGEIDKVSEEDINALLERTFEYHAKGTGLIGTVESGVQRLLHVREADVDEVACLIDFGVETPRVLESLRRLTAIRERLEQEASRRKVQRQAEGTLAVDELLALARQSGAVLLHASARLARTLAELPRAREALEPVGALVLDGASTELALSLHRNLGTEVLLAGAADEGGLLPRPPTERVPEGLQTWVLDAAGLPVPPGVVGELALEGAGLPWDLWRANEQERRRFVQHPSSSSARLFRTGRHARLRVDGRVEHVTLPAAPKVQAPAPKPQPPPAPALPAAMQQPEPAAIPRVPRTRPLPLSFAQQRLWYLQQLDPSSTAYNNGSNFRLGGALNIEALQAALNEVVKRHEVLRTTYQLTEEGAVQVIHAEGTLPMPVEDVPGDTAEAREAELLRRCTELAAIPFDLEQGPVARALLLRMGPEEHVLSLMQHHVISDAWCTLVLGRELSVLYSCFSAGVPSPLPPLEVQYADYAVWQRKWLEGAVMEAQLRWWKEQLTGVPALELPTDRPRPAVQSYAGGSYSFELPAEVAEPLLAFGRREGATSFMVLMALFQAVLGRTSGQEDFAVGIPTAGRSRPEVEGLLGCFVNTLALRSRLEGAPSFRELVGRVKRHSLEAFAHQDAPFERVIEALQLPRDQSRTPVFQVVLNVINTPSVDVAYQGLKLSSLGLYADTSKFDLSLEVVERKNTLYCRFEYASGLFDGATLERLASHLTELAQAVVATPDLSLQRVAILSDGERQQVLKGFQGRPMAPAGEATIHALMEAQAARTPDAVAVVFESERLTYRELDARANQVAHHLRGLGVKPESLVGVCLERSVDMVVSLLGVLKAGAAYVPVDPAYPRERLGWMLEDTGASVLLTHEKWKSVLPQSAARVVCLDSAAGDVAKQPVTKPDVQVGAESLAYVIFTSGSTGRPKGAMNAHGGVVNRLKWMQEEYGLGSADAVLQKTPFSFDVSVWEFFWPLLAGAKLVVARPGGHQEPAYLVKLMKAEGVTTVHFVPSMLRAFVEEPRLEELASLRRVVCSGEALSAELVKKAYARLPAPVRVHNLYGPTEAAVDVTYWPCPRGEDFHRVPIGRPVANTALYVLDTHGQPTPIGIPGELHIGGVQVGRGYWQRPQLTAERFIPDAFSGIPGARLYRTGDVARWLPDGTLEYLGRADFQVKLRGFRIELGEIEAALRVHPGVRDAVAMVREETRGDARLVAYVTGDSAPLEAEALRAHLLKQLPQHMVPSTFVHLGVLPLTPSGKVDRKALPAPDAPVLQQGTYVAPRTPTEEALAELFAQVLGVRRIGVHDGFFELGGHSLLATQVVVRVRTRFGIELPLRAFFESPTVAGLAAYLDARKNAPAQSGAAVPALTHADRRAPLPLSFSQQRLWVISQWGDSESSAYNHPLVLQLTGVLNLPALQQGFDTLVARHEVLRTTFRMEGDSPVQVIHPPAPVPIQVLDLTGAADARIREEETLRRVQEEVRRPFDLSQGPVVRGLLMKQSATEHVLVLNMHHIVTDGWSNGVMVREMAALYAGYRQGQPSPLPALPFQYVDFAAWQRKYLQGRVLEAQLDYWRGMLADAPAYLELPTDKPRPEQPSFQGESTPIQLPEELSEAVDALALRERATPFMVLLAAFQVLLNRYSGQDDVVVGSPIAGRRHAQTEGLIGFFVNTLALRARFGQDPTFRELLAQVRDTTLGAYEHQDLPVERLVEELQPAREEGRTPLFQVMFALQNTPAPELTLPELTLRGFESKHTVSRFELELVLSRVTEGYQGGLVYNTDLFEPATAERLVKHLRVLLAEALESPDTPVSALSLEKEEEPQLSDEADFPREATFHLRFEEQAARTPDAPAVTLESQVLTYAELNAKANQLAAHLRTLGVKPEVRVGLCLERTPDAIVAVLAVLKAGGAFVPIDPAAPAQRKSFVLKDSDASVLVTLQHLAEAWKPAVRHLQCLDTDAQKLASLPTRNVVVDVREEHLAYVIYTSGSTGTPKGVMVQHRSLLAMHEGTAQVFQSAGTTRQRISLNAPFHFDGALEPLAHLADGHCLCLVPEETRKDPEAMLAWLGQQRVDVLDCTPAQLTVLLQAGLLEQRHVPSRIVCAGEAMPPALWKQLASTERTTAYNAYGPTESTVCATAASVRNGTAPVPVIGRPIQGTRAYVLDARQRVAPAGIAGELYLSGEGLARGYLGRPELTAERFIPDAFSGIPGARLYRTGDKARWRHDGTLEYLGRLDFQVKLRGFRIELGEIEAVLRTHEQVRDAVVLAREDVPGDKRLVAYVVVVVTPEAPVTAELLRQHVQERLPEYMVPSTFVLMGTLPLTPTGKVDRKALPVPDVSNLAAKRDVEPPATPMEARLAELWKELLRVPAVGRRDSFFELGGHSLLATQAVARIRATFDVELNLRTFFAAPTVAALAERLSTATSAPKLPPLTRASRDGRVPLSFAQQRLWFLEQLQPGNASYNMPTALRLSGVLDVAALQRAVDEMVRRHESLRTTFHAEAGEPHQVIHAPPTVPVDGVDLSAIQDRTQREAEALKRVTADARRPFDLSKGPLLRVSLLKLEPSEHVLLLCMHHIISDGWSMGVLVREVTSLYGAFHGGQAVTLPELPVQYADYAVWQRGWLQGDALKQQFGFWKEQLAGAPHALELPTDKPRPAFLGTRGASVPVRLSLAHSEAVESLAQREGVTPFMVLLAAYQVLLNRYSAQDDVLVGSPIAGRQHAQTERLIGFFVNTLVLRARFNKGLTFRQLLAQVRDTTLGAYEYQDLPVERLVEELQVERDPSRTPLFQTLFTLQNAPMPELVLPGLKVRPADGEDTGVALFELSLDLVRGADGFEGTLNYSTDLYEAGTAQRLASHYQRLLESILARPDERVAVLPMMAPAERQALLDASNGARELLPADARIHALFEAQVARTPEAVAVVAGACSVTYRELDARANALAHRLRAAGVGLEHRVAVCVERSVELLVALLGVLKAGGAYVPLDSEYPTERLRFMLEDSGARVIVARAALRERLGEAAGRVWLDAEVPASTGVPQAPAVAVPPEAAAYVLYTSGSTGRPKGVVVQHQSLVNFTRAAWTSFPVSPGDRVLQFASISWDTSAEELYPCLTSGGTLVLRTPDMLDVPGAFLAKCEEAGVTQLNLPTAFWHDVTASLEAGTARLPKGLKWVVTGGERVAPERVSQWRKSVGAAVPLLNTYGLTEVTAVATSVDLSSAGTSQVSGTEREVPIGRALKNVRLYVLDRELEPVPGGVPGELFIGGSGVARGYLGRPELTAERFVPSPFVEGERLYRTGDLARWRRDGNLEYLGRADTQVKLRGVRIEPGEIEAALRAHATVHDAVVQVREDAAGDKRLVAYVVPPSEPDAAPVEAAALREHLRQSLPEYMVPAVFVSLTALPLTPSGKVDRRALPAPEASQLALTRDSEPPATPMEVRLAEVWKELLRVPAVGRRDNFFELGGHSLMATRVVARIRADFDVELSLRAFFEAPTVAGLAERLGSASSGPRLPPLTRAQGDGPVPLSFAQQRLWFLDQLQPGDVSYNMPTALRMTGTLHTEALQRAVNAMVERHQSLRTTFQAVDGEPRQVVHPPRPLPLSTVDLSALQGRAYREAEALKHATRDAQQPFDLSTGPLLRITLLKLAPTDHVLLLCMHHIISDGWSMGVLIREVGALYEAFQRGQPATLPELPLQYADFATWQRGWMQGETLTQHLAWWKSQLAGAPHALELPTDKPRPAVLHHHGAGVLVHLPLPLSQALEALAHKEGATPFMLLLAAFQVLLCRHSGQDDVLVGSPIAGRRHAETEPLIGFFVNTLVLRGRIGPETTFRQLLAQVRDTTLGAYEHQDVPFERLVEELQPSRDLSRTPLFQALFALQNAPGEVERSLPELTLRELEPTHGVSRFELELAVSRLPEGYLGALIYSTELFEPATAEQLVAHLKLVLEGAVASPDTPVSTLPLHTEAEHQHLMVDWNSTAASAPRGGLFLTRFEQQVGRTPNAPAVAMGEQVLSFAQLNAKANQLAAHLRTLGVGPEVRVAVCLERTPDTIVSLLAVLKAGGAFVPIDPAAPAQRRSFVLKDSDATVLLTVRHLADAWTPQVRHLLCLDTEASKLAALPPNNVPSNVRGEHLAYVIYTSGSTGTPKGVMVQHRSVPWLLQGMTQSLELGTPAGQRLSLNAPLHFDGTVERLVHLAEGHCLCLVPEETRKDPEAMVAWLEHQRVDMLDCTPAQLALLLQAGLLERGHVPSKIMSAGEAIPPALWKRLASTDRTTAYNAYGPTEVTVCATATRIQGNTSPVPVIGRPIAGTRVYVLDARQQLVPLGTAGELCVAGEGVARGYLGRPDLTAERFIPDAFSGIPGARLYRTGDKARWRHDGTLEYLGRLDFQVKLRGFRIELGEIEAALRAHDAVHDVVVLAREDVPGDKRLVAYVVGDAISVEALREHVQQRLPEYMVPSSFVSLPTLPLTSTGKVNRKALPPPDASQLTRTRDTEPPATPMEARLADIWKELLRLPAVGRRDNFFELGGHSLLATQVVARIRAAFDVELNLRTFFETPTVAALAERLSSAPPGPRLPPLKRVGRDGTVPLSFAQQRLWFLDQLKPGDVSYNMPSALRLSGALDVEALRRAVTAMVERHESLRTTFQSVAGEPRQVIHPPRPAAVEVVDLSGIQDRAQRDAEALKRATRDAQQPFDLSTGPLLRVTLLTLEPSEHVLLLCLHHIVSDGWSMSVLVRELTALYESFLTGTPAALPELPVQYADYAVWQRGWLQGETLRAQLGWWKSQLAGAPHALELPTDKPRPEVLRHHGAAVPVRLPQELALTLEALAQREGVTPFMALLAAFQSILARHSGQDDVLVGSPIAGRRHAETEPLIGFFVNTLVLRGRVTPATTFRQLLAQVRDTTLGAYEHQDVPFERLVEELQPSRDLSRTPLFQVMFALQNTQAPELSLPRLTVRPAEADATGVTLFELSLDLARGEDGYEGALLYSTELFERATAERLATHLRLLLEHVVASPDVAIATLPLHTETEQQLMVVDWHAVAPAPERGGLFHSRFEQQAARTPAAPAVTLGATVLSFAQLNAKANQLAAHLRTLGVGPEVRVALCLERTPDAIVAVLAVLKAGGAFVPIDPAAPSRRKSFVLKDSSASVLLSVQHLADAWKPEVRHLLCLDTEASKLAALPTGDVAVKVGEEHLAYVIYTSGSTGTPKGVMVQHRSLAALQGASNQAFHAGGPPGQRFSLNAPLYFDVSMDQLVHLADGHCLCLLPEDTRKDPEAMLAWLEAQRVEVLDCTPAQLTLLLQAGLLERAHVPARILCAGEAMDLSLWSRLASTNRTTVFNAYGPTESTVYATYARVRDNPSPVPVIGKPLTDTRAYVLDARQQLAPLGSAGELYLAGDGLARGYLGQPHLTAERFVPNPFATTPGERLYRTGDKARWRHDGTLEYLGRLDFQVKLRGFRIELGEVEAALRAHDAVHDAVVLAREDVPGDKRLVAYVVGDPATAETLRSHLQQRLPEYMVPSAFVSMQALPLTPSGKVDRKALPSPTLADTRRQEAHVAPRDALELRLVRAWEQVLGVEPISVRSSFFELGGHSLLAVRLIAALRESLDRPLPLAALFQAPTVEQLAAWLRREDSGQASPLVPFDAGRRGTNAPFFCVHPVGGSVLAYAELARLLGPERPFYGLQARGLDGGAPPLDTVEAMASAYVDAIREVQPSGPYLLGGWSVGGVIAYEMARQLRERGEAVGLLALIDAYTPDALKAAEPEPDAAQVVSAFASDLLGIGLTDLAPPDAGLSPEARLEALHEAGQRAGALPPGMELAHLRALLQVFESNLRAARRYQPPALNPGRVLRLKATEGSEGMPEDGGWKALVGAGLEQHPVPGDHYGVLRAPGVRELADRLRSALNVTTG